ncbi:MAG: PIG-L family deacetylase [Isosphaeraceae bacterium]|nr:PIG-L family deacetylase [Isosphaeraceae bacterium]
MAADPMRILAIHAHPDDVEFLCAGTLALLAEAGHRVTIATMTPGDCGSAELDPVAIAAIRRKEAAEAARLIDAEYRCLEFRDLAIFSDDDSRRRVVELLRAVRPDLVLTASPVDYMADHEATAALVRDACFIAPIPNYKTRQWDPAPPTERIPHLYYVDPIEGIDHFAAIQPVGFHVDVTRVFPIKQRMLACHDSQRSWLAAHHGMDEYLDSQRRWGSHRGGEIGVDQAEGFRQYLGHAYPRTNLLLELLEQDGRGGRIGATCIV